MGVLFGLSKNFAQLFLFRSMDGFFSGTMGIAQAMIADLVPQEERTAAMSKCGSVLGLALVLAPSTGALLMTWGFTCVTFFGAALTFFNFFLALFSLPQASTSEDKAVESAQVKGKPGFRNALAEQPRILAVYACLFLFMAAVGMWFGTAAVYLRAQFGFTARNVSMVMGIACLTMVFVQALLVKPLAKLLGEPRTICIGTAVRVVIFSVLATRVDPWVPWVAPIGMATSMSIVMPCAASILTRLAPVEVRGAIMGAQSSVSSAGTMLGPVLGGYCYSSSSPKEVWSVAVGLSLVSFIIAVSCICNMDLEKAGSSAQQGSTPAKLGDADDLDSFGEEEESDVASNRQALLPQRVWSRRPSAAELVDNSNAFHIPVALLTPDIAEGIWSIELEGACQRAFKRSNSDRPIHPESHQSLDFLFPSKSMK